MGDYGGSPGDGGIGDGIGGTSGESAGYGGLGDGFAGLGHTGYGYSPDGANIEQSGASNYAPVDDAKSTPNFSASTALNSGLSLLGGMLSLASGTPMGVLGGARAIGGSVGAFTSEIGKLDGGFSGTRGVNDTSNFSGYGGGDGNTYFQSVNAFDQNAVSFTSKSPVAQIPIDVRKNPEILPESESVTPIMMNLTSSESAPKSSINWALVLGVVSLFIFKA